MSRRLLVAAILVLASIDPVVVDDWRGAPVGSTGVPPGWRTYGRGGDFKDPPVIVRHDGRFAHLAHAVLLPLFRALASVSVPSARRRTRSPLR